ncbi:MAG: ribonuclease H-like domain-containing protein [Syntrophales bacterium]|nr:ribonuclease H-like domain-containing protein [Syntrophales bacterium]
MNIRDRLSLLTRYRVKAGATERTNKQLEAKTGLSIEELVPGEEISNEKGCFFLTRYSFPGSFRHGCYVLRDCTPIDTHLLSILTNDPSILKYRIEDGIFLDTETTGLVGGTGTLPFLIGLGWFEKNGFSLYQIFLRDYDEERAALHYIMEFLREKKFLITFNGKAFDVNLLNTRFILNRLPPLLENMPHADLLYPARRIFKHRLNDRSLSTLEQVVLGLTREGDVPGYEIPHLYFAWLKRRDARIIARVFEHNRLDVLSLVTLAAKLTELIDPDSMTSDIFPGDKIQAGRIWSDRCAFSHAVRVFESLRSCEIDQLSWLSASRELSIIYRRLGCWEEAVSLWKQIIVRNPYDTFALIELAKYYEHRARNIEAALDYAKRAQNVSPSREIAHRIERLSKRLLRR